jgi:amino acid transporter
MSDASDASRLSKLGYAQELRREVSGFQSFALSFSVISVLTGATTLYKHGLLWGGPLVMTLGWPLVAAGTVLIALSLAELASAFPTAGALYHWASILGGKGMGWVTAWLNTVGQFAITAGIDYGLAEFLAPLLQLEPSHSNILLLFGSVLVSHAVVNHVGIRLVAWFNVISAWYHVAGVALLVSCVVLFAPKQPASFLLTSVTPPAGGWMPGVVVGLLQAAWTFTGYDASAHTAEETHDATINAPRGILTAVIASAAAGWVLVVAVTLAIQSLPEALLAPNAFLFVLETSLGGAGRGLVWLCVGAMWFCGLASVTSNSRMLWAFARDGGLPASRQLASVSRRWKTPHVAIWISAACAFAVSVFAEVLSVMTALSTVALYASYGIPILATLMARRTGQFQPGQWSLGKWGPLLNGAAVVWIGAMMVVMSLPPTGAAGLAMSTFITILVVLWLTVVRTKFQGPRVLLRKASNDGP